MFGAYADSESPDQTARRPSLIRALAERLQNHLILKIILTNTKRPIGQTGLMWRLIWVLAVCICPVLF